LKSSPAFPPIHTVRASFPAYGVPSIRYHQATILSFPTNLRSLLIILMASLFRFSI
jgi:hypothetical protein